MEQSKTPLKALFPVTGSQRQQSQSLTASSLSRGAEESLLRKGVARIKIVHSTEDTYRNAVGLLRHRLMLRPDDSHDLRLHDSALDIDPERKDLREYEARAHAG